VKYIVICITFGLFTLLNAEIMSANAARAGMISESEDYNNHKIQCDNVLTLIDQDINRSVSKQLSTLRMGFLNMGKFERRINTNYSSNPHSATYLTECPKDAIFFQLKKAGYFIKYEDPWYFTSW